MSIRFVHSLMIDGVAAGIGSVISLPTIVTLFFFLSILEDTGYMARAGLRDGPAAAQDRLVRAQYRPHADWVWLFGLLLSCRPGPFQ